LATFDARSVYFDLVKAMKASSKGASSRKKIIRFLIGARYGQNVSRCSAEHFVHLYKEKFRLLDELHPSSASGFSDEMRVILLQDAVREVDELDRVRADHRLLRKGEEVTFEDYVELLEQAAIDYDKKFRENKVSRSAYFASQGAEEAEDFVSDLAEIIDEDLDAFDQGDFRDANYELFKAHQGRPSFPKKTNPSKSFQGPSAFQVRQCNQGFQGNPRRPTQDPQVATKAEIAHEVWAALPPEVKAHIRDLRSKRQVQAHEVTSDLDAMDPDAEDQVQESPDNGQDQDNPLLDFLCGDLDSPSYGDIREVLAAQRKRKPFKKGQPSSNPPKILIYSG
jgi:hypothetical protein